MSSIDIGTVFQPTSSSVLDFLRESGQCLYIPAYQRPYSWGKDNVERLFSDVVMGLNKIIFSSEALTFIGTIICIHDTNYKGIHPIYRSQVPNRVMTVIDGQQRITSITLLNTILHAEITRRMRKFENKSEDHFTWIFDHCSETISELEETIWQNKNKGDKLCRFYPKIIRAIDDKWSTQPREAEYNSPIGRYLFSYIKFVKEDEQGLFKFDPKDGAGLSLDKYSMLCENRKQMMRTVNQIAKGDFQDFPEPKSILTLGKLSEMILRSETPKTVLEYLGRGDTEQLSKEYLQLVRLLLFTNYLNRNVAVTVVTTKEEDYAFDMFEALNTTGEPLSAFETFKPKIIAAEGESEYEKSPSYKNVQAIDDYLAQFKTANERQSATSNLLIPFALLENGEKIGGKLNDQRFYLRRSFDKIADTASKNALDEKREFVRIMSNISRFLKDCWPSKNNIQPSFPGSPIEMDDQALICLDFLKQINHSIVIAIISAFYTKAIDSIEGDDRKAAFLELFGAIKAITAFSVVWRASEKGTQGIENVYRELMSKGLIKKNISGFSRQERGGNFATITLTSLQEILRYRLQENKGISNLSDWNKKMKTAALYDHGATVARFLLFLALNNTNLDNSKLPLLQEGRKGKWDILDYKSWKSDELATVEHVAPQSQEKSWDSDIYEDDGFFHTFGNLSLLPAGENSMVGNGSWAHKKLYFRIFSSQSPEEFEKRKIDAQAQGINFSRRKQDILEASQFLNAVKPIADFNGVWDKPLIQRRSQNLSQLSWRYLSDWLGM